MQRRSSQTRVSQQARPPRGHERLADPGRPEGSASTPASRLPTLAGGGGHDGGRSIHPGPPRALARPRGRPTQRRLGTESRRCSKEKPHALYNN
eukprot:1826765-Pyramimonas_sp.AAC.1